MFYATYAIFFARIHQLTHISHTLSMRHREMVIKQRWTAHFLCVSDDIRMPFLLALVSLFTMIASFIPYAAHIQRHHQMIHNRISNGTILPNHANANSNGIRNTIASIMNTRCRSWLKRVVWIGRKIRKSFLSLSIAVKNCLISHSFPFFFG